MIRITVAVYHVLDRGVDVLDCGDYQGEHVQASRCASKEASLLLR